MSDKKQPHYKNNFFQTAFSRKETAMGLAGLINPEVSAAIDWDSLKQESTSFVDPSLSAKEADVLYSVKKNGDDAYVYILLEHQSTQPKWMMLRMIGYIARICEHYQKTHPEAEKLPVVLPIVLYQGTESWTRPTQFKDYFEINEQDQAPFSTYIPDFKCEIISLPELPVSRIVGDPYFTISMRMMKALRDGSLLICIDETRERLEFTWVERQDHDFVLACFFYALHSEIDKTEVLD